ncbi:MAG: hypothetical protein RLZ98_424 [Pseudomonadota bacterium]|jgi:2'-5' RNA ligase
MPRLFTALELPDDVVDALDKVRQPLAGARWVNLQELHITLRFAGDISNRQADDFAEALGEIDVQPFEVRIAGLDVFGGAQPRVLWARVEPSAELSALARAHERAARSIGLAPETRKFKPHVTLARLTGTPPEMVARLLQRKGHFGVPAFVATRFVLYSSRMHVGGGPYVVEAAYPFAGIPHIDDEDDEFFDPASPKQR